MKLAIAWKLPVGNLVVRSDGGTVANILGLRASFWLSGPAVASSR
jgi:hypothetical protein